MKKATIILALLLMIIPGKTFSQDQKEQNKMPVKPALLVIDIQNAFLPMIPDKEKEVGLAYINALIDLFRKNGYPVIRIYHKSEEYGVLPDTDPFEYPTSVHIRPDDPKIIKTYGDGFNKTHLDDVIKKSGSNTLFLCGLSAVGCVLATRIGAENHDYTAFFVKDAIMSHNSDYTNDIEDIFDAVSYDVVKLILENSH